MKYVSLLARWRHNDLSVLSFLSHLSGEVLAARNNPTAPVSHYSAWVAPATGGAVVEVHLLETKVPYWTTEARKGGAFAVSVGSSAGPRS